jgi:hypothetical protein
VAAYRVGLEAAKRVPHVGNACFVGNCVAGNNAVATYVKRMSPATRPGRYSVAFRRWQQNVVKKKKVAAAAMQKVKALIQAAYKVMGRR